jgi:Uma2 family endonuclease
MAANPQYDDPHGIPMTEEAFERLISAEKFARYRYCPTLEVYILVSQDERYVEVYQRAKNWRQEHFSADQVAKLDQLNLELPLTLIYEGVFS